MNDEIFQSYSEFLGGAPRYTRVPKKILVDTNLSESERKMWMILASFQFEPNSDIFPSRFLLANLMGIENHTSVSRITASLEKKGYLHKDYGHNGTIVYYSLNLRKKVPEMVFFGNSRFLYKKKPGFKREDGD